ncbi:MAG: hypothetical protein ACYDAG_06230 [Chloroflexota bacterium]
MRQPGLVSLVVAALALSGAGWLGIVILVLSTDPGVPERRLFTVFTVLATGGLGTIAALSVHDARPSRLLRGLRGIRRGMLFGLACAGAVVLQFNAALKPTNVAFLLVVLLIVEMIFLARRREA